MEEEVYKYKSKCHELIQLLSSSETEVTTLLQQVDELRSINKQYKNEIE